MNNEGVIEVDYLNKARRIEFSLNIAPGYGGKPMITLKDKNNHHHSFLRNDNAEWRSLVNVDKWPENFLSILFVQFEEKYQEAIK